MPRRRKLSNLDRVHDSDDQVIIGLSCIGVLWTILSFLSLSASCVGFYMPYWLEGTIPNLESTETSLGIFRRCNYLQLTHDRSVVLVEECGRYSTFSDIPSEWWRIGTITVSFGCILSMFVSLTGFFSCCVQGVLSHCSAKVAGVLQFIAGVSLAAGCILYPLGWSSFEVRSVCGQDADIFKLGSCQLSWAYYTIIGGCGGTFLCALLSCHTVRYKGYERPHVRM